MQHLRLGLQAPWGTHERKRNRAGLALVLSVVLAPLYISQLCPWALAASNPIVIENRQPGSTGWQLSSKVSSEDTNEIRGYASAVSINKGQSITFYVTVNPAQTFNIDVYRVGWYGGTGGRLMQQIGPLKGATQTFPCPMDSVTGMISCNWSASYSLTVPTTWTDGIYLARLSNANGYTNYIIFAVRDDSRMADLLYSQPVNTYQAYNNWPADHIHGKDLHAIDSSGPNTIGGDARAVKVSFDRPYSKNGAHLFFNWEIYFIHWMEKMGYDVTYTTNIDMHANPKRMAAFKGVLSVGHDEYWSKPMYV